MLVEGIRPILPLIRNTPYGKRIQSKLQREQMEMASAGNHYGGYNQQQQQQQALLNAATLANQGLGLPGQNMHGITQARHIQQPMHANPLANVYNARTTQPMYGMAQGSVGMHAQQALHPGMGLHGQQHSYSLAPHGIDGYLHQGNGHAHGMGSASTYDAFGNGMPGMAAFNNTVGIAGALNDPYQRTSFSYGM